MTSKQHALLHISPHPDDELLGAPAAVMALRDQGWRVVNLACSFGRAADADCRRAELTEACRRAGFELVIPADLPPLGRDDDLEFAQARLATEIEREIESFGAVLVVGPSPEDRHHGHEVVGRAIVDAVESQAEAIQRTGEPIHVMFWGLWRDLAVANVLVPFDSDRLMEIQRALAAHSSQLARNRYERLLEGRAMANAVLGPERVFGYGREGVAEDYAELLMHLSWSPANGWRPGPPRVLDPAAPFGLDREGIPESVRQREYEA